MIVVQISSSSFGMETILKLSNIPSEFLLLHSWTSAIPTAAPIFSDFGEETLSEQRGWWYHHYNPLSHDHEIAVNIKMVNSGFDEWPGLKAHSDRCHCFHFEDLSLEVALFTMCPWYLVFYLREVTCCTFPEWFGHASTQLFDNLQRAYTDRLCIYNW